MRLALGDAAAAEAAWKRAIAIDPQSGAAHYNLSIANSQQGKADEAKENLAHAARLGYAP